MNIAPDSCPVTITAWYSPAGYQGEETSYNAVKKPHGPTENVTLYVCVKKKITNQDRLAKEASEGRVWSPGNSEKFTLPADGTGNRRE